MARAKLRRWAWVFRRWRWFAGILAAASVAGLYLACLAVLYSNEPYRDEIAADLMAYAQSQSALSLQAYDVRALESDVPALFQVGKLEAALEAVMRHGDLAEALLRGLDLYESLERSRWTPAEAETVTPLREADDPAGHFRAMLLDSTSWIAAPGQAEKTLYLRYGPANASFRLNRLPYAGYKAVAMANARWGDPRVAIEASLAMMEALGSVPRPWHMGFAVWLPSELCDIENTLIAAVVRAPLGPDQLDRHTAAWDRLREYDGLYEAVRVGATQWIEQSRGLPLWRRVQYEYNVYAYGRQFEAICTGAEERPFDLFGYAVGMRMLADSATDAKARLDYAHGAKTTFDALCALRRYEAERGALPGSMAEWPDRAAFPDAALRFADGTWRAELSIIQGGSVDLTVQPAGASSY